MIPPLAGGDRDGEPVARRWERAGRVGSVGARRILQTIEVEHELTGFIEAVGGIAGVEKTAGSIGRRGAGRVTKNEEKLCDSGIFKNRLEPKCFSREAEFRGAGNGLIVAGADERSEGDGLLRSIGNPSGDDAKSKIGIEPFESTKTRDSRRMRILNAKSEARLAADQVHVESAEGEMRGNFVPVGLHSQGLRFCGDISDKEVSRESCRRRIQRNGFAFEVKDGKVGRSGREMDFVVRRRTGGIVSGLEPFEANKREPAVGLEEIRFVPLAPDSVLFLPGSLLRDRRSGQREQKNDERQADRTIPEAHEKSIPWKRKGWKLGLGEGECLSITSSEFDCLQ